MIFKLGLTLLLGASFGLGLNQVRQSEIFHTDTEFYEENSETGYCHNEGEVFTHMLDNLSEEERLIVEEKIDELLIKYDVSLEELYNNRDIHYDFMDELMTFLDEEGIDYHYNNHYDDYEGPQHYGGHMGN
ncbi:MAG: hypothetical protein ACVCEJ_03310 [Candidatus Izemoplasmataceae bacterium]